MKKVLAILALAGVAACSGLNNNVSSSVASSNDPASVIATFTLNDVKAADAPAKATGDTLASTCYEYLIPKVQQLQASEATANANTVGAISFAEVSRGIDAQLNAAKAGLNVACAPLALDSMNTALQLAGKFATVSGAVATGGTSLLAP